MEIDTDSIGAPEDFEPEFQAAYQNEWKGVLVIEVNPQSLEHRAIPIDELGFEMSDIQVSPDPAP